MLGWDVGEFAMLRMDLLHLDDVAHVRLVLDTLFAEGGSSTMTFRMRHKDGHYVWIESNAQRVPGSEDGGQPEIIYAGRDVTHRVEAARNKGSE